MIWVNSILQRLKNGFRINWKKYKKNGSNVKKKFNKKIKKLIIFKKKFIIWKL